MLSRYIIFVAVLIFFKNSIKHKNLKNYLKLELMAIITAHMQQSDEHDRQAV